LYLLSPGFDMTWELDVFGRVRRSIEAADATTQASVEGYRDVLVTLFGEVALAYVDLRTLQQRLAYADANIKLQQKALDLARARFDAGLTGRLDLEQARANLATHAQIPSLRLGVQATLNSIAFLVSQQPGSMHADLLTPRPIPSPSPKIADLGLPAGLVRQRLDIRRAERALAAQTALIGVLTADLYPRLGISGNLSLATADVTSGAVPEPLPSHRLCNGTCSIGAASTTRYERRKRQPSRLSTRTKTTSFWPWARWKRPWLRFGKRSCDVMPYGSAWSL
jgi:outer membrane protein TolC